MRDANPTPAASVATWLLTAAIQALAVLTSAQPAALVFSAQLFLPAWSPLCCLFRRVRGLLNGRGDCPRRLYRLTFDLSGGLACLGAVRRALLCAWPALAFLLELACWQASLAAGSMLPLLLQPMCAPHF